MVCRENKARSAFMGYSKHMLRQAGYADYSDPELQSMIHEQRHRYEDASPVSKDEYVAFLVGFRQQVIADNTMADAAKYREGVGRASQPGVVTRIDQELERMRTGKHEDGSKLTKAQMNLGRDFAAMQRLVQPVTRAQQAKEAYFELHARHMGIPVEAARDRYNDLVSMPASERLNTNIKLADTWKDDLAVSGLSAQQQADMGQSNQQREALRIMEHERRAHLAALPKRPAFSADNTVRFISPEQAGAQCVGGCGQFGHTADQCPHSELLKAEADAAERHAHHMVTVRAYERQQEAAVIRKAMETDPQPVYEMGGREYDMTSPTEAAQLETDLAEREAEPKVVRAAFRDAAREARAAKEQQTAAQEQLEAERGPIPHVSGWLQSVSYNPDTGATLVRTRPYTLKDGTPRPSKPYLYHMGKDDYDQMMASENPGEWASNHLMARASQQENANDRYKYANEADAAASAHLSQCSSCGRWASPNTSHQCPVSGSLSSGDQYRLEARRRHMEEIAELSKLPVITGGRSKLPRFTVHPGPPVPLSTFGGTRDTIRHGMNGTITMPDRGTVLTNAQRGAASAGKFSANYLGAHVTGRVDVWNDPNTGERLTRVSKVKCSCGASSCRHAHTAASTMSAAYGSTRTYASFGESNLLPSTETASDNRPVDPSQLSYNRINKTREAVVVHNLSQHERMAGRRGAPQRPPQVRQPFTWTDPDAGVEVNLQDRQRYTAAVVQRLGQRGLDVEWREDGSGTWVRPAANSVKARAQLSEAFGMSRPASSRGIFIPTDNRIRHEMLNRVNGGRAGRLDGYMNTTL